MKKIAIITLASIILLGVFTACVGTPTPPATVTPRPSDTPSAGETDTPLFTDTPILTITDTVINTSTPTKTIAPNTSTPSKTNTQIPTKTWTYTPSFTPTLTPSRTIAPSSTWTPSQVGTNTPVVTISQTPTRTPSRTSPPPTATTPPPPTNTPGVVPVKFADEFGNGLSSSWHPCPIWWSVTGSGLGGNEPCGRTDQGVGAQAWFVPAAVTVPGDGYLHLTASKRSTSISYGGLIFPYNSGYTITARQGSSGGSGWFTYGYFETRFRCPAMAGSWCAFWLWADPNGSNEIDITETLANNAYIHNMNLHGATTWSKTYRMSTPNTDWHVYAVDWQAGRVVWYVDGIETGRYTGSAFNGASMYVILSLQLGGSWAGAVDASKLPTDMVVDWIRVYTVKP